MSTSTVSFTLGLATSRQDLDDACTVRAQAYGHHVPELGSTLGDPDRLDHMRGTAVLLCRDKASGAPIATARIQRSSCGPLMIERSLILPRHLQQQPRAEITRLAVLAGADPQARLLLMKASYLYCLATQIRWLVIGARSDALIRNYRRLGFTDVLAPGDTVPLAHAGNLAHRILSFDVVGAERTWQASPASPVPLHDRDLPSRLDTVRTRRRGPRRDAPDGRRSLTRPGRVLSGRSAAGTRSSARRWPAGRPPRRAC